MNFDQQLTQTTKYVDEIIKRWLPEQAGMQEHIIEAANYSINAGGKRIRPILMLETYRLCGGTNEQAIESFMVAIECIHTYSLVHDDLPAMDNDDYRRGNLTTHKKYGEDFGVLAGDALLNYAYELMLSAIDQMTDPIEMSRGIKAAKVIAEKAGIFGMVGGQSLDVLLTDQPMNKEQMEFIFNLKTGALIEAAFMAGAILAGATKETVEKLCQAGNKVGVAFQIKDDILDVTSTQEVLGKPVFSDERNNKTTYVTLYGLDQANQDVAQMSEEAIKILQMTGNNPFLENLIMKLISRVK
jgi:geranylgeranyl diphosphate synthase type II